MTDQSGQRNINAVTQKLLTQIQQRLENCQTCFENGREDQGKLELEQLIKFDFPAFEEHLTEFGMFSNISWDLLQEIIQAQSAQTAGFAESIKSITAGNSKMIEAHNKQINKVYMVIFVLLIFLALSWGYIFPYLLKHPN